MPKMENPAGYLYRVVESKTRWYHHPRVCFPEPLRSAIPEVEPKIPEALMRLTRNQRSVRRGGFLFAGSRS